MAKKSAKRRSQSRAARQAAPRAEVRQMPAAPQPAPVARATELADEYRYVIGDLKRVGILAAAMLVLLVALALVAQYIL